DPHRGAGSGPLRRHRAPRARRPSRGLLGGGRCRPCVALQDVEFEGWTVGAEGDDIPVREHEVSGDALAVDEGAVLALLVLEDVVGAADDDRGMARRDVEVAFGVEADVREGVPSDADVGLGDSLDLSGSAAGQELDLRFHFREAIRMPATTRAASATSPRIM